MSEELFNFEKAFVRLEEILERMHTGNISLDDSLKLFEEADNLLACCNKKLQQSEARIEMLIKKRDGELVLDEQGRPETRSFEIQEAAL